MLADDAGGGVVGLRQGAALADLVAHMVAHALHVAVDQLFALAAEIHRQLDAKKNAFSKTRPGLPRETVAFQG